MVLSGTRIVLLFFLLAVVFIVIMYGYGRRVGSRYRDTPDAVLAERIEADNTVVGLVGGVERVVVTDEREIGEDEVGLAARVLGARDSGRVYADLAERDDRWRVVRAAFVLSGGRRLPLEGSGRPALEPAL